MYFSEKFFDKCATVGGLLFWVALGFVIGVII